jgi:L-ascorbate metabolism protein UlaG (beta-lactamase superfamily)
MPSSESAARLEPRLEPQPKRRSEHESAGNRLTFVGTATTILRLGGFTLLTDPNFLHRGQRVHLGYGLFSRRLTEPALQPDELPALDAMVLSHLHGDHFDRIARRLLDRALPIVTTAHAARRLLRWGFRSVAVVHTWQSWALTSGAERLTITAVPGQHGPAGVHRLLPPVMGTVLQLCRPGQPDFQLYITGDTVNRSMLREVGERFPALDAMVMHLGGTRVLGVLVTMDGRQGTDLMQQIRPGVTVPVHYDDYSVFRSPLQDFLNEAQSRGLADGVQVVQRGETVQLTPQLHGAGASRRQAEED